MSGVVVCWFGFVCGEVAGVGRAPTGIGASVGSGRPIVHERVRSWTRFLDATLLGQGPDGFQRRGGVVVDLSELDPTPGTQVSVCIDGACGTADPFDGAWWSPQMLPTGGSETALAAGQRTAACIDSQCGLFEATLTSSGGVPTCASSEEVTNEAGDTVVVCRDIVTTAPVPSLVLLPAESRSFWKSSKKMPRHGEPGSSGPGMLLKPINSSSNLPGKTALSMSPKANPW